MRIGTVSRIGLGLAALGRPGYINVGHAADFPKGTDVESMERHALAVLDAAYAGGVRYFDAARSYGMAEAFLGYWLLPDLELGMFDTVQATSNLLDPSAGSALAAAHGAGVGVIVKEALANGRLTSRAPVPVLAAVARDAGVTPDVVALAAVLRQEWADIVLSGAATVPDLESNLTALDVELDPEQLQRLEALADPSAYWEERGALPWN